MMGRLSSSRAASALALLALAVLVGLGTTGATILVAGFTKKRLALGLIVLAGVVIAGYTRRPREILLFGWVVSLTYGRMYYSFDGIFGNNGSQGLYWIPADMPMLALLGLWGYEAVFLRRPAQAVGGPTWYWFAPFAVACLLSAFQAQQMNWALFEFVRILKFGLLLYYFRYNLTPSLWRASLAGLATAVVLQGAYGSMQVVTQGRFGSFFGSESSADLLKLQEEQQVEWHRATGTLGHPNIFGPFMLLLSPMFLCLGLASPRRRMALLFLATAMCGYAGAVLSLSRMAWFLAVCQLAALWVVLVVQRVLPIRWAIGAMSLGLLAAALTLAPFADRIEKRLTGDWSASVKFRARHDVKALEIFQKSPALGIGLSNYVLELAKYEPDIDEFLLDAEIVRLGVGVRVIVAVHNLYLLLLSETGFVGLATFVWFLLGVAVISYRAIRWTQGAWKTAMIGLAAGILTVLVYQVSEFSLWIDPVLYPFALVVGLLNAAPAATAAAPATPAAARASWGLARLTAEPMAVPAT